MTLPLMNDLPIFYHIKSGYCLALHTLKSHIQLTVPKLFGFFFILKKYQANPPPPPATSPAHTMCQYGGVGPACGQPQARGLSDAEAAEVLDYHNRLVSFFLYFYSRSLKVLYNNIFVTEPSP